VGLAPHSEVGEATLAAMLARAELAPPGAFVEVGVFQGGTLWHLAALGAIQGREVWGYDTFTGQPWCEEGVDSHKLGDFSSTTLEAVREAVPGAQLVRGVFPESAIEVHERPVEPIAFAHIDCDQARSYRETIAFLRPLMARGGVMWFDDAPCLPGARREVERAFATAEIRETEGKWWVEINQPEMH
jgi:hypothetical protein